MCVCCFQHHVLILLTQTIMIGKVGSPVQIGHFGSGQELLRRFFSDLLLFPIRKDKEALPKTNKLGGSGRFGSLV